jgi:hypothetical protein
MIQKLTAILFLSWLTFSTFPSNPKSPVIEVGLNGIFSSERDTSRNEIVERTANAELVMKIGSDKENEDFFNPSSFAVDSLGRILILDSGNSRIQVFSRDGAFLFSFGKLGQGPGELSKNASKIKILNDGNIYVIDNTPHKINVYTSEGKFLSSIKAPVYYNDIVMKEKKYYLSGLILKEEHKPIDIMNASGTIESSFGILIDPGIGLIKQINQLAMPEPWRMMFCDGNFSNLLIDKKGEIIYSQTAPYRFIKYDAKGRVIKDIVGQVDFDTHMHVKFAVRSAYDVSVSNSKPSSSVFQPSLRDEGRLLIPYMDCERDIFFFDLYDQELNLISRFKIRNIFFDSKAKEYIGQLIIDKDEFLYGLVVSQENSPRLVKYKIGFR